MMLLEPTGRVSMHCRIENRTKSKHILYRQIRTSDQAETADDGWETVKAHCTRSFAWENPQGEQILEVAVNGVNISPIQRYDINKAGDHPVLVSEASANVCAAVMEHGELKVVRFYESEVQNEQISSALEVEVAAVAEGSGGTDSSQQVGSSEPPSSTQLEVVVDIGKFGLSVCDHNPREILFLCLENVTFSYSTGDGTSRYVSSFVVVATLRCLRTAPSYDVTFEANFCASWMQVESPLGLHTAG